MADQNWFTANAPASPTGGSAAPADWFAANAAPPPAPAGGSWYDHPVLGRTWRPPGVAPGQDPQRRDPVLRIGGTNDTGGIEIAPEDVLMLGQAGRAITGAAKLGGALGGVRAAVAEANPVLKYEVARRTLHAAGMPDAFAVPLAMVLSGYRRRGGAAAAETAVETQVSSPGFPKLTKTPAPPPPPPSGEGPYGSAPGFPRMTRTDAPIPPPPSGEGPYGSAPGFPRMTRTAAPAAPPPSGEGPYGNFPKLTRTAAPPAPPPSGEGPYGNFPKLTRTAAPTSPVPAMVEKVTGPYGSAPGYPRLTRTEAPISPPEIDFPTSEDIISGFDHAYAPRGLTQKTLSDALNDRLRQWLGGT